MIMNFSERNRHRCEAETGFNHKLDDWSLSDWMTALTGEVGEAANIIKKLNRIRDRIPGNKENYDELMTMLASEFADIYVYLDLIIQRARLDKDTIVEDKFKITSEKIGYVEE